MSVLFINEESRNNYIQSSSNSYNIEHGITTDIEIKNEPVEEDDSEKCKKNKFREVGKEYDNMALKQDGELKTEPGEIDFSIDKDNDMMVREDIEMKRTQVEIQDVKIKVKDEIEIYEEPLNFTKEDYTIKPQLTHTEGIPYKCRICNKVFSNRNHILIHMKSQVGERPYKCCLCNKCFSHNSSLNFHLRTNSGNKQYKCKYCEKSFSHNCAFVSHLRIHTGENKCSHCDRTFKCTSNLKKHLMMHTGIKPYPCSKCDKAFTQKSFLTDHLRIHKREKPYQCIQCEKAFTYKCNLKQHLKTHTRE